jgi:hypothetical protein
VSACPQLNIGLMAYGVTPQHVMVKVPNERGRWVLTDRCVVEVACPTCGSIVGEPCANRRHLRTLYWSGTHCTRRAEYQRKYGWRRRPDVPPHKLRVTAEDLAETQAPPPNTPLVCTCPQCQEYRQ